MSEEVDKLTERPEVSEDDLYEIIEYLCKDIQKRQSKAWELYGMKSDRFKELYDTEIADFAMRRELYGYPDTIDYFIELLKEKKDEV